MQKNFLKIIIILLIIFNIVLLGAITGKIFAENTNDKIILNLTANEENNNIRLDWNVIGENNSNKSSDYKFKVYSKKDVSSEYESIGTVDYESSEIVKVLNVYPNAGNTLKTWMETNGYGMGIVKVDAISINEFNSNPSYYLGTSGKWNYDVIFFGTWDSNNGRDLNQTSRDLTRQFIEDDRGVIFGHDTIAMSGGILQHPYFSSLANYVNITTGTNWSVEEGNTKVMIAKKGIFTTYPWNIGDVGTILNVPMSHPLDQTANGTIWLRYVDRAQTNHNVYLTTWNNCAMIQTGHSNATATDDEQKIIANLILYVKQTTTNNYVKDYSGMDVTAPNKVENAQAFFDENGNLRIEIEDVEDNGTVYSYYVEGINNNTGEKIYSEEQSIENKSGLKGYSYIIDNNDNISSSEIQNEVMVTENVINLSSVDITKGTYLHIAAIDNAGNISEVSSIKLKYFYRNQLEIVSSIDTNQKLENVQVRITGKDEDEIIVFNELLTSDENGIIEVDNELELGKKMSYTVIPISAEGPYMIDRGVEYEVAVDSNGNLSGKYLDDEQEIDEINVNNLEKEVKAQLLIDNKKVQVEIEKVDSSDENIKLPNAGIKIVDNSVITDENGKATTRILAYDEGTHSYSIEETKVPTGYNGIKASELKITYDKNGDITSVNSTSSNIVIKSYEKEKISLQIKNDKKKAEGYMLQIEAINMQDENIKVGGATYKIEIIADSGEQITTEKTTDENGLIQIPNLNTIGKARVKITQTKNATGYKQNSEETIIIVNRNSDGTISSVEKNQESQSNVSIESDKKIVVTVLNEPKEMENRFIISVSEGADTTIENLKFSITDEYGISTQEGRTDEDGNLFFENIEALGTGDFIYIITPETNNIYGIDEIRVAITFDGEDKIVNVQEVTSETTEVKIDTEETEDKIYSDAHIILQVEEQQTEKTQKLKIVKVDKDDENKKLSGVTYKVKQKTDTSVKTVKTATDAFGEIDTSLLNSNRIELTIKELKSITGYKLDDKEKVIVLEKNENTGLMEIDEVDKEVEYEVDEKGNITIIEKNQSKVSNELEAKANICFFLTKKNKYGSLLGNVEFELIETKTGRNYTLTTDSNGYVELHDFEVPEEGTYEFYLTETSTVTGYSIATAPIKLIISYEEYEGEMKTSSIIVERGYKYIEYKECNEYETDTTYQLDVIMTIINEAGAGAGDDSIEAMIDVSKVDSESNQNLNGAQYEITIKYENGTTIKNTGDLDILMSSLSNIHVPEGENVTITFKETVAPIGYHLDSSEKEVVIRNERGVLKVVRSNTKKAYIVDNKIVKVELEDSLIKKISYPPRYTSDPGYKLKIINNNQYNDRLRLEESVFNVKVDVSGTIYYDTSRGLGRTQLEKNTIQFGGIKVDGTQTITIKQTRAPLHHIINDEVYTIEIKRDWTTETIQLLSESNPNLSTIIDNDEKTITVLITNEPSEILFAINKVDAEDNNIGLANIGFMIHKYNDTSNADLRTYKYIKTENNGVGYGNVNTYITNGTALYSINEVNTPEGYYSNGQIGIYITTDKYGNITAASTVENSSLFDKGKCTINKVNGKYIEITIINERKPEPTYSVIIDNRNKYDELTKVGGSIFNVQITQSIGANINTNVTTGGNGLAAIDGLNGQGKIQIRVEQIKGGDTYKKDPIVKTIEVGRTVVQTVSENGNFYAKRIVLNNKNPNDVEVTVNNEKQQIIIKVLNERAFGLEIEKVDIDDKEIKLPGAKFEIYQGITKIGETTTNEYGRGYIYMGDAPRNQTVQYTLKETKAPLGYSLLGNWYLNVTFNKAGEIDNLNINGSNISNEAQTLGYMRVKITEPKAETGGTAGAVGNVNETYTNLEIIKEGYNNPKLNIEKVVFDIYTEAEDGRTIRAIKTTDSNGEIKLYGIPGNKIKIKLTELETAYGYVLDNQERQIVVQKVKTESGKEILKLDEGETSSDLNVQIDEDARLIQVNIKNNISEDFVGLAIVKEDVEDELLTLMGAKYEIKDEDTEEIYSLTTSNKGIGSIYIPVKKTAGTYLFKIKEIEAPKGYVLDDTEIDLEVSFELDAAGNPYVKTAKITKGEAIAEIQNQTTNYIEVHTINKPEDNGIEPYTIKVVKVDRDDISITLPGATLQIDVQNSVGQTGLSKTAVTDGEGKIMINNVRGAGDVKIDITELIPPTGRKFDSKEKASILTKDSVTGRIKLIESKNVDTIIDNKKKIVTILVRNELVDGLYTLVVQKNDNNNKNVSLSNVKMKIQIPGEESAREVITDKEGRIVLTNLPMPVKGTYTYKITEIETIEGYNILDKTIEFTITFDENLVTELITNAKITKGEYAQVLEVLPKYVRLAIYNVPEEIEEPYKITFKKIDAEDNNIVIENTKVKLTVEYENGVRKTIEEETNEEGKICLDNLSQTGNATITVEEKKAVQGYDLDTEEKIVKCSIKDSNNITILEKNEDLEVNLKEKEIEIIMTNDRSKEYINLHLEKYISKVNEVDTQKEPIVEYNEGSFIYKKAEEKQAVKYGDIVEFTLRVYNEGTDAGYAKTIKENIPDGLEYIEDNEINISNGWIKKDDGTLETNILSKEISDENIIEGYDAEKGISYKDVKILLRVVEKREHNPTTENIAIIIETEDIKGNTITEKGVYEKDNSNAEKFEIEYTKFVVNKEVVKMFVTVNGVTEEQQLVGNKVNKIEIYRKDLDKAEVEIEYEIKVTNMGTVAGKIESIIDYIPEGMELVEGKNEGWTSDGKYLIDEEIGVEESITKKIVLKCNGMNLGNKVNVAAIQTKDDIEEDIKSEEATVIVSVKTGSTPLYIGLSVGVLALFVTGIYLIKKKALR